MAFKTDKPYVAEVTTATDLEIATLVFGCYLFTLCCAGPSLLSAWSSPSFAFFFSILTLWALQVQFLLQIIINRVNLLWSDHKHQQWLKYGTAAIITAINISVYCIWVPARSVLQISAEYIHINKIWDRCEKCIYLVVDALLNILFIRVVKRRLVGNGLERYRPLVGFNQRLILVSISMDVLMIGMMSLPNSFVYMAFHPLAYLVKLLIEMQLGALIVDISTAKPTRGPVGGAFDGLKIAVATTTTTAYHLDDEEELGGGEPIRTTRTPARPDLQLRLAKMRRERQEKKDALAKPDDVRVQMQDSRRGSDYSLDQDDKIELEDWSTTNTLPKDGGHHGVTFIVEDRS
ncbi:hypothetical protein JCM10213_007321 [Rhodosporidiobolus nylandii]